ncbi:MAG: TonB-dependent receptor [Heteroscytonema crispum UTEX LB 1556]
MRNFLIISDLNYLHPINETSIVVGGNVYAGTVTATTASPGSATAVAGAGAIGETTYTDAQSKITVKHRGSLNDSRAEATAIAYARTGDETASSSSRSISRSLQIT